MGVNSTAHDTINLGLALLLEVQKMLRGRTGDLTWEQAATVCEIVGKGLNTQAGFYRVLAEGESHNR